MLESTNAVLNKTISESKEEYIPGLEGIPFSFVPNLLLSKLRDNIDLIEAYSRIQKDICLIVDISGFTRLSGRFCQQGKEGIDNLQKIVNGYMGTLVRTVYEYGGDVIKFAGDALICVFPAENNSSFRRTKFDALICAWVLKELCTDELTVHIGISYGDICFGILGGEDNRWDCLISGQCLSQLSQCLDDAPSKQITLTAESYEYYAALINENNDPNISVDCRQLPSSNYLVVSINLSRQDLKPLKQIERFSQSEITLLSRHVLSFVPEPVNEALSAGSFNYLAELREVTTMFMKWDGYSETEHKDLCSLQKHFLAVQQVLKSSGGFMRQFLVDDKGCVLIAMWGVPSANFSNNCGRALWAATELRDKLHVLKMDTSCGITTGNVYCGTVGSEMRREYAAIGDVVNLAARLMCKAQGSVYVDETTYLHISSTLQQKLLALPEIMVKGKDKPIQPYKYIDEEKVSLDLFDASIAQIPIRAACKVAFEAILTRLHHSSSLTSSSLRTTIESTFQKSYVGMQFLILEGAAGSGRGQAISWLKIRADSLDVRTVSIVLIKTDATRDFLAMQKLFRSFIGEENFDDMKRQTFVINRLLDEIFSSDRETLEKVAYPSMRVALGITCPLSSNRKVKAFSSKVNKIPSQLVLQSLTHIFKWLFSERPTLAIIQNIQFMDESSWRVLHTFTELRTIHGAMILTKNRPHRPLKGGAGDDKHTLMSLKEAGSYEWVEPHVGRLKRSGLTSHIELSNYSFMEVRSYLAQILHTVGIFLPKDLDSFVFQLSGGNPFWVHEICRFIKEFGMESFQEATGVDHSDSAAAVGASSPGKWKSHTDVSTSQHQIFQAGFFKSVGGLGLIPSMHLSTPVTQRSQRIAVDAASGSGKFLSSSPHESGKGSDRGLSGQFGRADAGSSNNSSRSSKGGHGSSHSNGGSSSSSSGNSGGTGGYKLSALILTRFAKLSTDEQSVARSASIIGMEFSTDILAAISSSTVAAKLDIILQALVDNNWLRLQGSSSSPTSTSTPNRMSGAGVEAVESNVDDAPQIDAAAPVPALSEEKTYSFVHAMVHHTIYELTPLSVQKSLHLTIAQHAEATLTANATGERLQLIGDQYLMAGDSPRKSFEFLAKAADFCLSSQFGSMMTGIACIGQTIAMVQNPSDVITLRAIICKATDRLKLQQKHDSEVRKSIFPSLEICGLQRSAVGVLSLEQQEMQQSLHSLGHRLDEVEEERFHCDDVHLPASGFPAAETWQVGFIAYFNSRQIGAFKRQNTKMFSFKGARNRGQEYSHLPARMSQSAGPRRPAARIKPSVGKSVAGSVTGSATGSATSSATGSATGSAIGSATVSATGSATETSIGVDDTVSSASEELSGGDAQQNGLPALASGVAVTANQAAASTAPIDTTATFNEYHRQRMQEIVESKEGRGLSKSELTRRIHVEWKSKQSQGPPEQLAHSELSTSSCSIS